MLSLHCKTTLHIRRFVFSNYYRSCNYCQNKQNFGLVSRCEEDYDWQTVWAYCKPARKQYPVVINSPGTSYLSPILRWLTSSFPRLPAMLDDESSYEDIILPFQRLGQSNWTTYNRLKRSVFRNNFCTMKKINLYLPYQCSCRTYRC